MQLNLLVTSDVHGYIVPTNYVKPQLDMPFGLERAATCLRQQIRQNKYNLIFDDGDYLEGSPMAYYLAKIKAQAAPTQIDQAFNTLPYDYGIVGNHEFNYGQKYLLNSIQESNRQFLCANVTGANGEHPFGKPYVIRQIGSLKIAIMGVTTQGTTKWEKPANLKGLTFHSVVDTAKKYVPMMRKQADLVIIVYHGGFERNKDGVPTEKLSDHNENEGYQLLKEVKGIDVLITGHQHRVIAGHLFGVPVIQVGHRGEYVGKITLHIQNKQIQSSQIKLLPTKTYSVDPTVVKQIKPLQKEIDAWLNKPLARIQGSLKFPDAFQARIHKCSFVQLIQRIQMATMGGELSATALFNDEGHGFGNPVTMRNILTNYVYPNTLVLSKITGQELKAAIEKSAEYFSYQNGKFTVSHHFKYPKPLPYCYDMYEGVNYVINVAKPVGHRVVKLTYHGQTVRPDQTFKIVLNQYRAVGGGHFPMFHSDQIIKKDDTVMNQIIANYLQKHPVIQAKNNHNFKVIYQK